VLEALTAAGVEARAASTVDEEIALKALQDAGRREAEAPTEPEPTLAPATFAELAEEAEKLAPAADSDEPAADLEPPDWVVEEAPEHALAAEESGEAETAEASVEPEPEPEPSTRVPHGPTHSLATIGFDELRSLGMSITQAKRVLRYRNERGGFRSVDALDNVPGFPRAFLTDVKRRLTP
jgi:Helix-hairpin-helix motif